MESPPSVPVPGSSFVILSVSIVGILSIALLLLAYYLFLTRCGLLFFWRADDHQATAVSVSVVQEQEPPLRSGGLEEAAIRRIPTFRYGGERRRRLLPLPAVASSGKAAARATECAVCLADFRDGERLRLLPPCLHAFHIDCIDAWLQATATCPLCRAAVVVDSQQQQQLVGLLPRATDNDDHHHIAIDIWPADGAQQQPAAAPASPSFLPVRRSLSMDSSTDKRFYLALQRLLHHSSGSPAATATQGDATAGSKVGTADGSSSRRLRRTFFSFSQSRGESRSAVLPLPL